jgi:HlyD family secretion protein
LANAQARLKQVQAKFVQAEAEYNRNKKLFDSKTISQSEFEISSANYQSSKAEVDASQQTVQSALFMVQSSEASLKEADDNLKKTTIYAPVSGTISMLNVEKGERVVGTIQMTGTELLRIADLNKMEALVDVNENDILRIHLGDTAMIEVDAYPDRKFKGIVTEVANSSKNSNSAVSVDQVTDFEVRIKILPSSYQDLMTQNSVNYYPFRPGMSTTVDIQTRTVKGVLSVPVQSVTTRTDSSLAALNYKRKSEQKDEKNIKSTQDDSPHIVVFVIDKDDKALMIDVKIGIQDNDYIEILTGLVGNENVVSAPYSAISKKLNNGTKVKKTDKENLYKTN